ncbi:unnamed protein product, partial [Ixodes pacificus]
IFPLNHISRRPLQYPAKTPSQRWLHGSGPVPSSTRSALRVPLDKYLINACWSCGHNSDEHNVPSLFSFSSAPIKQQRAVTGK